MKLKIAIDKNYSVKIGLWKTIKNGLVLFVPAILAFLANVPTQYVPVAGLLVYFVKNFIENK